MKKEVCTLALDLYASYMKVRGVDDVERLIQDLDYDLEYFKNKHNWITYDEWLKIERRVADIFPGEDDVYYQVGLEHVEMDTLGIIRILTFFVPKPKIIYNNLPNMVSKMLFTFVKVEVLEYSRERARIKYTWDEGYEPTREWAETARGILESIPVIAGQEPARATYTEDGQVFHYTVEFAKRRKFLKRVYAQTFQRANYGLRAMKELQRNHDTLQKQYDELKRLNDENRRHKEELEVRVQERTSELMGVTETLKESLNHLHAANAARTRFFANVSHELRTPLTLISTPLQMLLEQHRSDIPAKMYHTLDGIQGNCSSLMVRINGLIELARNKLQDEHINLAPVDCMQVVHEVVNATEHMTQRQEIEISLVEPGALTPIVSDRERLKAVIENLVTNAIKYNKQKGTVAIALSMENNNLTLTVSDTGIGMSEDELAHIFDRYYRGTKAAEAPEGGLGLGLSITKESVELLGGTISVSSAQGEGTIFTVRLPGFTSIPTREETVIDEPQASNVSAMPPQFFDNFEVGDDDIPMPGNPTSVLVVEDNKSIADLITQILPAPYEVRIAPDTFKARSMAKTRKPDLMIIDVMLPGEDGLSFCRELRTDPDFVNVPFMLLTAVADANAKLQAFAAGARDYVVKPFHVRELLARIGSIVVERELQQMLIEKNNQLQEAIAELRETQSRAMRQAHLSSLGQLTQGIAHELLNPLSFVDGGAQTLQLYTKQLAKMPQPPEECSITKQCNEMVAKIDEVVTIISTGTKRMTKLVHSLQQMGRSRTDIKQRYILADGIAATTKLVKRQLDMKRISLDIAVPDTHAVLVTPNELNEVLLNLVLNAIQAMPEQGQLSIASQTRGKSLEISIQDTGPGIPNDMLEKIFDPFFTTKSPQEGMGVGLSISSQMIEAQGGHLKVRNAEDGGAIFTIELPAAPDPD